jgi:N-formylglutamate deformylase
MSEVLPDWLVVEQRSAPLIVSIPHAGVELRDAEARFVDPWLARKDADWRLDELYAIAARLGATIVRTNLSRSIIDVNRDPSGASLYPGQSTTELCPATTFDGEPLYRDGMAPDAGEIAERTKLCFDPYHSALRSEIARLRANYRRVALYDAHSIRSKIPRLFEGELPVFNLGLNSGQSCSADIRQAIGVILASCGESFVVDGRFKGGWITRSFGKPEEGVEAVQMELACRAYLVEPKLVTRKTWPRPIDSRRAAKTVPILRRILEAMLERVGR